MIVDILYKDKKQNTYKIALIRAINDIANEFCDLSDTEEVIVPLRKIAEYWLAYYWVFVDVDKPIWQAVHKSINKPDMIFRVALTEFRQAWEYQEGKNHLWQGYVVKQEIYKKSDKLLQQYHDTLVVIQKGVKQPIVYAGTSQQKYFDEPRKRSDFYQIVAIPNINPDDMCFVVPSWLWKICLDKSEWVEAMCVDAWCLFIQDKAHHLNQQPFSYVDIYPLVSLRPHKLLG